MQYKNYIGKYEFDDQANIFHGEVINIRDVITFQARTEAELEPAFRDSVVDYLEFTKRLPRRGHHLIGRNRLDFATANRIETALDFCLPLR